MKLIYIDEAGNTGTKADPDQPIHLLSAVMVDEAQVRPLEEAAAALAAKWFGPIVALQTEFEFHGSHIHRGAGPFKGLSVDQRIALVGEVLSLVPAYGATIGYAAVDKLTCVSSRHPHQLAFLFLAERIEDCLRSDSSFGLLIADENRDIEQKLIDDLDLYKRHDTSFGWRPTKLSHIVDSIHFVRSKNNWLIQLADVVAFMLLRGIKAERKISAAWLRDYVVGVPFEHWLETTVAVTRSERMDYAFRRWLAGFTRFSKMFPT
jgi:hypothetical protein